MIAREGSAVPASVGPWNFGAFTNTNVQIDEAGNVYYYATWNDPDTTRNSGVFRNDELIVQKGVTAATTGELVTNLSAGQSNLAASDNGRYLVFEGTVTDPPTSATRQGTILVELPVGCPADITPIGGDGAVNVNDLLAVIGAWGDCATPCPPHCTADIDQNCAVNVNDLLAVVGAWGPCP